MPTSIRRPWSRFPRSYSLRSCCPVDQRAASVDEGRHSSRIWGRVGNAPRLRSPGLPGSNGHSRGRFKGKTRSLRGTDGSWIGSRKIGTDLKRESDRQTKLQIRLLTGYCKVACSGMTRGA
ncbi:hypothetical protein VY88_12915 [Azospirillum thiophilum]|uniref:Uncharacterized protein n=1 Tax=Azospirillum thiophilum TaxID=528244 RepID=A0AAC8ZU65_9PROT|nr:hypothetical protein AL072_13820 [Azospirillum thiophilum]KJR66779.1 hypothetical protein VY88_12915 [Azospirillum thiophilum]